MTQSLRWWLGGYCCVVGLTMAGAAGLAADDDEKWVSLFDGKTLEGWTVRGGFAAYKVEDGAIVGTTVEKSPNSFLCKGDFKDFVLELEARCAPELNSGVQVRSHVYEKDGPDPIDPKRTRKAGVVHGPQCEIANRGKGTSGRFWDESRRRKWLDEGKEEARSAFQDDGWNRYRVVVQGNRYRCWLNGDFCSDFKDDEDTSGFIGLQVHAVGDKGPFKVRWRNIRIHELKPDEKPRGDL